jgi:putative PIN family toxin of toxin-antitoxin system
MPRVVADANVLISAALARSPNAPSVVILEAALDGRLDLVTSPQLLGEITNVLKRPRLRKYLSTDEALRFVADLATQTILLTDPPGRLTGPFFVSFVPRHLVLNLLGPR